MATEKRLIDFEMARKNVLDVLRAKVTTVTAVLVVEALKGATVDAVELVHGRWIPDDEYDICSHCNHPIIMNRRSPDKWCKNCGAKMDGERKDNEL